MAADPRNLKKEREIRDNLKGRVKDKDKDKDNNKQIIKRRKPYFAIR